MSVDQLANPKKRGRFLLRPAAMVAGVPVLAVGALVAVINFGAPPRYPVASAPLTVAVTPERVAHGKSIAKMRCFDCHYDPEAKSATGLRITDVPAAVASATYAANITKDPNHGIGAWTDGQLAYFLRTGIRPDGSLAAPWMPRMVHSADEDVNSVIAFLRSDEPALAANPVPSRPTQYSFLGKALRRFVWKPDLLPDGPIVAPPVSDKVAYGRYVVQGLASCFSCHSADFAQVNNATPELSKDYLGGGNRMMDATNEPIFSANITFDPETGIGKWSEEEFRRAVREGIRPDGSALSVPMPKFRDFSDEQVSAVYAYLKTVPPIHKERLKAGAP